MATWYYMANQMNRIGPIDDNTIQAAVQTGIIQPNTFVFKVGEKEWKQASEHQLFAKTDGAQHVIAVSNYESTPLPPWTVRPIVGTGGEQGVELDFRELRADEIQKMSQLLQQYSNSPLSKQFPRIASGSHSQALSFFFPNGTEKLESIFSFAPLKNEEAVVFRNDLVGMASELYTKHLGLWFVDSRLAFHVGGQYRVVPSFWMPALATRSVQYQGIAPEWRDSQSQEKADMYAIACACFLAVTGKQYDPETECLPGDIHPAMTGWNDILQPALQKFPSNRPKDLASWLAMQPKTRNISTHSEQATTQAEWNSTDQSEQNEETEIRTSSKEKAEENLHSALIVIEKIFGLFWMMFLWVLLKAKTICVILINSLNGTKHVDEKNERRSVLNYEEVSDEISTHRTKKRRKKRMPKKKRIFPKIAFIVALLGVFVFTGSRFLATFRHVGVSAVGGSSGSSMPRDTADTNPPPRPQESSQNTSNSVPVDVVKNERGVDGHFMNAKAKNEDIENQGDTDSAKIWEKIGDIEATLEKSIAELKRLKELQIRFFRNARDDYGGKIPDQSGLIEKAAQLSVSLRETMLQQYDLYKSAKMNEYLTKRDAIIQRNSISTHGQEKSEGGNGSLFSEQLDVIENEKIIGEKLGMLLNSYADRVIRTKVSDMRDYDSITERAHFSVTLTINQNEHDEFLNELLQTLSGSTNQNIHTEYIFDDASEAFFSFTKGVPSRLFDFEGKLEPGIFPPLQKEWSTLNEILQKFTKADHYQIVLVVEDDDKGKGKIWEIHNVRKEFVEAMNRFAHYPRLFIELRDRNGSLVRAGHEQFLLPFEIRSQGDSEWKTSELIRDNRNIAMLFLSDFGVENRQSEMVKNSSNFLEVPVSVGVDSSEIATVSDFTTAFRPFYDTINENGFPKEFVLREPRIGEWVYMHMRRERRDKNNNEIWNSDTASDLRDYGRRMLYIIDDLSVVEGVETVSYRRFVFNEDEVVIKNSRESKSLPLSLFPIEIMKDRILRYYDDPSMVFIPSKIPFNGQFVDGVVGIEGKGAALRDETRVEWVNDIPFFGETRGSIAYFGWKFGMPDKIELTFSETIDYGVIEKNELQKLYKSIDGINNRWTLRKDFPFLK